MKWGLASGKSSCVEDLGHLSMVRCRISEWKSEEKQALMVWQAGLGAVVQSEQRCHGSVSRLMWSASSEVRRIGLP